MDGAAIVKTCFLYGSYFLILFLSGFFLYQPLIHFLQVKPKLRWKSLLFLTLSLSTGMVIWVGDPNLLYTFPFFLAFVLASTRGDRVGRLTVAVIFFCITMSVCALADTYLGSAFQRQFLVYDVLVRVARVMLFWLLYLLLRGRLPQEPISLPRRLWKLILGLSMMPLCAMVAVVLLTNHHYDSPAFHATAMNQGLVVLPFTLITSVILLFLILILADHEKLEQRVHLAGLREVYYQGLQREERQVRTLRHDLRNHVTALRGLLEQGEVDRALGYLSQMTQSSALGGGGHFCDNETANIVLAAKAQEMARRGVKGEFQVALPKTLLVADMDLCALLGNALDNAMEAAEKSDDKTVTLRCRAEKGLLMLRVENALAGDERPDLSTTKADKTSHGFGLLGMREIAGRYGGSLEATADSGRFELVVYLPLS